MGSVPAARRAARRLVVIAAVASSAAFSCSRGKEPPAAPAGDSPAPQEVGAAVPDAPDPAAPAAAAEPGAAPEMSLPIEVPELKMKMADAGLPPAVPPPAGADFLIPDGSEAPRYPSDFAIGPLGDDGAEPGSFAAASDFLASVAAGTAKASDVPGHGSWKDAAASVGPAKARLGGALPLPGGEVSFLVRFLGGASSVEGELILKNVDGTWKPSSFELEDARPLDSNGGTPRFDPFGPKKHL